MTDAILALVPGYGLPLLMAVVFLSCLALPFPASLVMLSAGSFVATGDLGLVPTYLAALSAAVAGDQAGYQLGRLGGAGLLDRLSRNPDRKALIARARAWLDSRTAMGVFLTRWLFSPLGPYVNFIGGATGLARLRFSLWSVLGEAVWVGLYVTLGVVFGNNIAAAADLASDMIGLIATGFVTVFLGLRVVTVLRRTPRG